MYISADCSRGSEDLIVTVTSNLGVQKFLEKKIVRDRCQNIEAWLTNYTKEINPCQSKNVEINIHNVGPFVETYTISSNYDKYISYNANSFSLEPNQYYKITANIKFDCSTYGQKDVVFKVYSNTNRLYASLNAQLDIQRDFYYDFFVNNVADDNVRVQVCNRMQSTKIPVFIKNNGTMPNTYIVDFDGLPKFATVEELIDGKFSLNAGEMKIFYVNIDSTKYRYEHKFKDFTIKITPEFGDFVEQKEVSLEFVPCYEYDVIVYDYGNSKNRPLRTCANLDYNYDINIINNGLSKESFYTTIVEGPSNVWVSKGWTELSPGDNDIVKLYIVGPDDNSEHKIVLKITSGKEIVEYREVWIKGYDTTSCHETFITKDSFRINYQTSSMAVPVKNKGIVDNTYLIMWNGSDIVKEDMNLLNVAVSEKGKALLNINSADKEEGEYTGTLTLADASGSKYSKDISITLKDKSFLRKVFEYLAFDGVCKQVSLYQICTIFILFVLIIVFLIVGPHYPYNFWNRFKSKASVIVFLLVLFLIGLILVLSFVGLPKSEREVYNLTVNTSGLTYEWLQNDKYVLDVSPFFYDPDNMSLDYSVEGLDKIKAIIDDKIISFYPSYGWSGTEYAKIIATDDMGGSVSSPEFT
ncbi:MAG: hypothetical protein ACP5NW_00940, partial [Candidatus Woesearchaeota archaeon]